MAKRSGDLLTGGTGDVNPQFLTFSLSQATLNAQVFAPVTLPVNPVQGAGGANKATVVELLYIVWAFSPWGASSGSKTRHIGIATNASTAAIVPPNYSDPGTLFVKRQSMYFVAGSAEGSIEDSGHQSLTDDAGHGILVGTPSIFASFLNQGNAALDPLLSMSMKIAYRFKTVSLQEYIGIVQSQQ